MKIKHRLPTIEKKKNKTALKAFRLKLQGKSPAQIAAELRISKFRVVSALDRANALFKGDIAALRQCRYEAIRSEAIARRQFDADMASLGFLIDLFKDNHLAEGFNVYYKGLDAYNRTIQDLQQQLKDLRTQLHGPATPLERRAVLGGLAMVASPIHPS